MPSVGATERTNRKSLAALEVLDRSGLGNQELQRCCCPLARTAHALTVPNSFTIASLAPLSGPMAQRFLGSGTHGAARSHRISSFDAGRQIATTAPTP